MNNQDLTIVRKNIKNIYLKVYPPDGRINLSVPYNISDKEIQHFLLKKEDWIKKSQIKMQKKKLNFTSWTDSEKKEAKSSLGVKIPKYIEKWEKIMNVKVSSWSIRLMKTRWGSCNIKNSNICINLSLSKMEDKHLEYIIVHEMIHLKERYHNKRFYQFMDYYLPEWNILKKDLKNA